MDITTLVAAGIGVVGALGGTLGGAVLSQRAVRTEARESARRAELERSRAREERDEEATRARYARLNTTARGYRSAARDALLAAHRGEEHDPALLDTARDRWAEEYAQAQMALPLPLLGYAAALNRALGNGYLVVRELPLHPDPQLAFERGRVWFADTLADGVWLLQYVLRHDLGLDDRPEAAEAAPRRLAALNAAREELSARMEEERDARAPRLAPPDTP
ncbi:hypothetical protein ACN20G_08490 [Streptomyces sp. BI20]|uniref:hypothetical protein n=1 Tax=Streptomyces sp. BI20 TaxID=3403460 RepID=UPI003C76309D